MPQAEITGDHGRSHAARQICYAIYVFIACYFSLRVVDDALALCNVYAHLTSRLLGDASLLRYARRLGVKFSTLYPVPVVLRAVPVNATSFFVIEAANRRIREFRARR